MTVILRPAFGARVISESQSGPVEVGDATASRVQVRLTLTSLAQAERDLTILSAAVAASLATVRRSMRSKDESVLSTVRANLEQANRHLNAYHKPNKPRALPAPKTA